MAAKDLPTRVQDLNLKLRAAKLPRIVLDKGSLYLQVVLPPKPGDHRTLNWQQRIPVGKGNLLGLQAAERASKRLGAQLADKTFTWEAWGYALPDLPAPKELTAGDWVEKFEEFYWSTRPRNPQKEATYRANYKTYLKRLPIDGPLTEALIRKVILSVPPEQARTRNGLVQAMCGLSEFAGLGIVPGLKKLKVVYGLAEQSKRELPDDTAIMKARALILAPCYRWIYGMMATYGLRPHEVFTLDTSDLEAGGVLVRVLEGTKTGTRAVWPYHPEWVESMGLRAPLLPNLSRERDNQYLGYSVSKSFRRYGVGFRPYDLRHAWAVRTVLYGLDLSVAARMMGHSVTTHTKTYHHWITDAHHQRAWEQGTQRPDRPKPPIM